VLVEDNMEIINKFVDHLINHYKELNWKESDIPNMMLKEEAKKFLEKLKMSVQPGAIVMFTENEKESLTIAIFDYISETQKIAEIKADMHSIATQFRLIVCDELLSVGKKLNIKSCIEYDPFWTKKTALAAVIF